MNLIIVVSAVLTEWITVLILLLLFNELGVFTRVHKAIKKNPKYMNMICVFGETLYGIGISVVGSVLFATFGMDAFSYKLLLGIALIAVGAYIKK